MKKLRQGPSSKRNVGMRFFATMLGEVTHTGLRLVDQNIIVEEFLATRMLTLNRC